MNIINKDILTVESGYIVHQCNARGVFGAGLAKQIRRKWPEAYYSYIRFYESGMMKLGTIDIAEINEGLYVFNCIAQEYYGHEKDVVYTNYNALSECLYHINS